MFYVIVIRYLYSIIRARDVKLPFYTVAVITIDISMFKVNLLHFRILKKKKTLIHDYHNLSYSAYKTIYLREIHLTRIKNIRLIPLEFQANPPRGNL